MHGNAYNYVCVDIPAGNSAFIKITINSITYRILKSRAKGGHCLSCALRNRFGHMIGADS